MKQQSENASSVVRSRIGLPDNQQERLKTHGWTVGFVDGEGSFSVNRRKSSKFLESSETIRRD